MLARAFVKHIEVRGLDVELDLHTNPLPTAATTTAAVEKFAQS